MENTRLATVLTTELRTERKSYDEYNENTRISGGKECPICNLFVLIGECYYIHDENHPKSKITNVWDETERANGKVKNRVCLSGAPRGKFVCNAHYGTMLRHNLAGYSTEQTIASGKESPNADGITTSFELETSDMSDRGANEITINHHGLLSSDSTVYIESKMPIYYNLSGFSKAIGKIESLIKSGDIQINYTCGTHLHTGLADGMINFCEFFGGYGEKPIKRYIAFFEPLALHISRDYTDSERIAAFGRSFGQWNKRVWFGENYCKCDGITYDRNHPMKYCHVACFNVQHSYSIEFRLPVFVTASQYRKIAVGMQAVMCELKSVYIAYDGDPTDDALRAAGIKARDAFSAAIHR